jgi:hypothetical protein
LPPRLALTIVAEEAGAQDIAAGEASMAPLASEPVRPKSDDEKSDVSGCTPIDVNNVGPVGMRLQAAGGCLHEIVLCSTRPCLMCIVRVPSSFASTRLCVT